MGSAHFGTRVTNLRPLANSSIEVLELDSNPYLTDLTGLESCQSLKWISLPKRQLNLDPIRKLPNLQKLIYGRVPNKDWNRVGSVSQY